MFSGDVGGGRSVSDGGGWIGGGVFEGCGWRWGCFLGMWVEAGVFLMGVGG